MAFVNSVGFIAITAILCATICSGKNLYDDIDANGPDGKQNYVRILFRENVVKTVIKWREKWTTFDTHWNQQTVNIYKYAFYKHPMEFMCKLF